MTFSAILRISEALGVEVVDLMKSSRNFIDLKINNILYKNLH